MNQDALLFQNPYGALNDILTTRIIVRTSKKFINHNQNLFWRFDLPHEKKLVLSLPNLDLWIFYLYWYTKQMNLLLEKNNSSNNSNSNNNRSLFVTVKCSNHDFIHM